MMKKLMQRIVEPEILDDLPVDDPEAVRSRADLRVLNRIIGGENWIVEELQAMSGFTRVVELGAGEGLLSTRIRQSLPSVKVTAVDLVQRPSDVPEDVEWLQLNVLEGDFPVDSDTVVVVNLFLHHLSADQLELLAAKVASAKSLLFAEPARMPYAMLLGYMAYPFVGRVTKHDMMVSIRAGFRVGDLPAYFSDSFHWKESMHWMGGLRSKAVRK